MKKIIKRISIIGMCISCDCKETYCTSGRWYTKCKKKNREIEDATKIPSWCPLENYKEKDNERNTDTKSN